MILCLVEKQEGYADGIILDYYPKGVIIVEIIIVAAAPGAEVNNRYVDCRLFMYD